MTPLENIERASKPGGKKRLDEPTVRLVDKSRRVPRSMFGVDKNRKVRLSLREHEEATKDAR
jgi:hypothetical protein